MQERLQSKDCQIGKKNYCKTIGGGCLVWAVLGNGLDMSQFCHFHHRDRGCFRGQMRALVWTFWSPLEGEGGCLL